MTLPAQGKGAYGDLRPTHDQLYLAERLNEDAPAARLSPAALQRLNSRYGVQIVTDALRYMRGFCTVDKPYPYLERICREKAS